MTQPIIDDAVNIALSNVLQGMDRGTVLPMLTVEGIDACDMHDIEIDSCLTMVQDGRFDCSGSAYWNYQSGTPSLSDEACASISGRIEDGVPVVERIFVSVR